jgi:hypothetical protein
MFFESAGTNSIEETEGAKAINIACVFRHFEGNFDVRLGTQIVHLCGLHLGKDVHQVGTIGKITIMELKFCRP